MRSTLRALEQLHEATRAPAEGELTTEQRAKEEARLREKTRRIASLSPYKQAEYHTLECIKHLRENLRNVEKLENALGEGTVTVGVSSTASSSVPSSATRVGTSVSDRAALTQDLARARLAARRAHQELQKLHRDVQRLHMEVGHTGESAHGAEEDGDVTYQELVDHIERAKVWYREAFRIHVMSSLDDPLLAGGAPALVRAMSGLGGSAGGGQLAYPPRSPQSREEACADDAEGRQTRNWREDAEFMQFFQQVEINDALIDSSLDRIHTGVLRLRDNAVAINDELSVQAGLLNETEQRLERNTEGVKDLNRRLARAIREMESSDICMYMVCLLVLVALLCVLLRIAA